MLVGFTTIFILSSHRRSSTLISQDAGSISTQKGNGTGTVTSPSANGQQDAGSISTQKGNGTGTVTSPSANGQQDAGSISTQKGNGTGTVTSPSANGQQDADVVNIKGKWDFQQAQKIALSYLRNNDWNNIKDFCNVNLCTPVHTIVGQYNLPYRNRETVIVATASIEKESQCHGCAPYLSFFEFEKRPNGWKLVNSYIKTLKWGQWGEIHPEDLKVYVIGDNLYGIELEYHGLHRGVLNDVISIYAQVGDSLREVLTLDTGEANGASIAPEDYKMALTSWDSHIKVQPGTTGFFDLLVERQGIRKGKKFFERELFKFDGQKYVNSELYK